MTNSGLKPDRSAQLNVPYGALPFLAVLYVICAALDLVNVFGSSGDPKAVGQFACSLARYAIIGAPNLAVNTLDYVARECAGDVREPAISMAFLAVKLS